MAETWTTDRVVTYVRNAERISGIGYAIVTDVVDVTQDGETRRMYRVAASVHGKPLAAAMYAPEGACGIRIDMTDDARMACIRELTRQVEAIS